MSAVNAEKNLTFSKHELLRVTEMLELTEQVGLWKTFGRFLVLCFFSCSVLEGGEPKLLFIEYLFPQIFTAVAVEFCGDGITVTILR